MIDLRLLREDPDLVRASQVARGDDPHLVDQVLDADARRRSALTEFETLRAEQKSLGKQVAQAQGDEKQALLAHGQAARRAGQGAAGRRRRGRGARHRAEPPHLATSSRTASRPAARTTTSCSSTSATARDFAAEYGPDFVVQDHLDAGRGPARRSTPSAAPRCPARGSTTSPGIGARLELALLNAAVDKALRGRVHARHHARRWSSPRSWPAPGSSAPTPTRSTASRPTTCTSSAPARSRSRATTRARSSTCRTGPQAVRRLVGLLPARGRLVRQGHPRDHPRAPVPQGRGVQLHDDRGRRRRAPPHPRAGRRRCSRSPSCRTA